MTVVARHTSQVASRKSVPTVGTVPTFLTVPTLLTCLTVLALLLGLPAMARAQDVHLLVVSGVGGDDEHAAQFQKWAAAVVDSAKKHGVLDANVSWFGEAPDKDPRIKGRSSKDNVTKAFSDLAAKAGANDEIFVMLIGHGSFDGKSGAFNLPGPDLTAGDYATLLQRFTTQKVVFVNTASSSGAFLQPLAGPARTIVTATKTGGERNETRFAEFFVQALDAEEADRDRNGRVSVQEAFDFATAKVKAAYEKEGHILTEHAALDDGSQGKLAGTLYLAPERSRTAAAQSADPALRALLEQRDSLERQVNDLRLKKDSMDQAAYDQQLEKLVTDLAVKTRQIRDIEGRK
ncbi:MAG TPA: C13 family peptidase [Vicinamibacterales bacterium]|nr:C13 family peptidase [Vicinamibacterales bacterium]